MSYPRRIQVLVVDDNIDSKQRYEQIISELTTEEQFPLEPPQFAFSLSEAEEQLSAETAFHAVVLDLCLPERPKRPAPEGNIDAGMELLDRCLTRDAYPIPAVLVISGFVSETDQSGVSGRLDSGFAYGRLLAKGTEPTRLKAELRGAVQAVLRYVEAGIHLRDGGSRQWPTLSPREDDLLRRAIMKSPSAVGLDLLWWNSEYASPRKVGPEFGGWTKVLAGRFLFSDGCGRSRSHFFKFAAAGEGPVLQKDADLLSKKLNHVKLVDCLASPSRALLVTEKVGAFDGMPESLAEMLLARTGQNWSALVDCIASQLGKLGDTRPDIRPPAALLFNSKNGGHDLSAIAGILQRHGDGGAAGDAPAVIGSDPVALLRRIQESTSSISHTLRACVHGDMNATNVAIDVEPSGSRAYIFDASNMRPGVASGDLAMLEVSALLHAPAGTERVVPELAALLYGGATVDVSESADGLGDRAQNLARLVAAIRRQTVVSADPEVYALMVFDAALVQVGGLAWSANKIAQPRDAVLLAVHAASWLERMAPAWLATQEPAAIPRGVNAPVESPHRLELKERSTPLRSETSGGVPLDGPDPIAQPQERTLSAGNPSDKP